MRIWPLQLTEVGRGLKPPYRECPASFPHIFYQYFPKAKLEGTEFVSGGDRVCSQAEIIFILSHIFAEMAWLPRKLVWSQMNLQIQRITAEFPERFLFPILNISVESMTPELFPLFRIRIPNVSEPHRGFAARRGVRRSWREGGGWGLRRLTFLLYGHRDVRLALVCPHGLPLARELITYNTQFCLLAENGFATTRYKLPERRY